MGLIRRQINSNLRSKIDEWFDQTFGDHLPKFYTIDDEFNIVLDEYCTSRMGNKHQCDSVLFDWLSIFYNVFQRHCTQPGTSISMGRNKRAVITNVKGDVYFIPEFVQFKFFSKEMNRCVHDEGEARKVCEVINYYSPYIINLDRINLTDYNNFGFGHIYRNSENKWILKIWRNEIVI